MSKRPAKTVTEVYLNGDAPKTPEMQRYIDEQGKAMAKRMAEEEKGEDK